MRITDIVVHPMGMLAERVRWTAQEITRRVELTLVEVRTDAGIVGLGEISSGPQSVVCKLLGEAASVIMGMDALAIDAVWSRLFSITVPRPGGLGGWDGLPPPLPRNQRPQFLAAMAGMPSLPRTRQVKICATTGARAGSRARRVLVRPWEALAGTGCGDRSAAYP